MAFGLIEAGFTPGDRLMLYADQTFSAESLVTQMGAVKAGVSVVSFDEKDDCDAFEHALATSKAKGLIFSPSTETSEGQTRQSFLQKLMPELDTVYLGSEISLSKFPHLKHVVQTGHSAMRGVNKFRDLPVYANPAMSSRQIPENQGDWVTHVAYKGGKEACSLTSSDLASKAQDIWDSALSAGAGDEKSPLFMSCDLESPMGFAAFLGCSSNFKKVFIPGTFNMSQMLQSVPRQHSVSVVCDSDFHGLEVPPARKSDYQEMCGSIKNILVVGDAAGKSDLFPSAKAVSKDKYNF